MSKSKSILTTREICISAILIAIAFVISEFIPVIKLPYGGKLTYCSMLFVCLIGYFFGPKTSLIASLAYGLLQLVMGSSIVHPIQLILDYPLAYTCLGVSGFFHNKKNGLAIGYILGVIGRYICHVISGIVFFSDFAEGNVFLKSYRDVREFKFEEVFSKEALFSQTETYKIRRINFNSLSP